MKRRKAVLENHAADSTVLRGGSWDARDIPVGKNIPLGHVTAALRELPAPAAYKLVVGLDGTEIENDWNFWLYPDTSGITGASKEC